MKRTIMIESSFEIKIALLGNVSAGKTTVLNALLRDKYGQTSLKRATAGVSYFRVHTSPPQSSDNPDGQNNAKNLDDSIIRSAKSTLEEISQDNVKLRESKTVTEKFFDIQLKSELVPMLQATRLVFVDIPGINEANTEHKYKDYVIEKWDTFDLVVVVMDARQGVNTEDSVFVLNFVKQNNEMKKDIPVIILCNKVDDPDDQEQAEMVAEARKEVEKIFNVSCRDNALDTMMGSHQNDSGKTISPVFIPTSAIHAYIHQSVSLMSRDSFETFDQDLVEKLGREQIGRYIWNQFSTQQKRDAVHKLIQAYYQENLKGCNFDKVLQAFSFFLGGESKQLAIIEKQIKTALFRISNQPKPGKIANAVKQVHESREILLQTTKINTSVLQFLKGIDPVKEFWEAYSKLEDQSFDEFKASWPTGFHQLAGPMSELETYFHLSKLPEWNDDPSHVITMMKNCVRRYFSVLLKQQQQEFLDQESSKKLTFLDWSFIWSSILLLSYDRNFCLSFGKEKIIFDYMARNAHSIHYGQEQTCYHCNRYLIGLPKCSYCGRTNESKTLLLPFFHSDGEVNPLPEEVFDEALHIKIPEHLSNPEHVSHIVWKYCQCAESLALESK